ncbi:hypothetical protein CAPTEDRAFT_193695 [Capitella teleta]|uniref:Endonuclease/exonuclease/phosphatase domain-containing protein n=1 Tax=Capitella teleta TaxID=283909 RepID=R7T8E3_CAPTE|nr:hypothetical protein CAPTEDRAFT_193695 [Capitella teleta]|eukprot:ELT89703.1 hypothetical protein CAPTEDRAFT_193695 [Capitella teleta]
MNSEMQVTYLKRNKALSIMDHVLEKEIDILAITETWLREGDAALVTELTPSGYVFQHITREARNEEEDHDRIRRGGGVGILIRKNIKHELVKKESSYQSFEMIEMKIYVQNKSIRIVNIYRYKGCIMAIFHGARLWWILIVF